ncbi:MAG: site-specific integrase [SAR202 cluster bacterium]|nr:site-specific integrase [SAR202 cluster bacterium]
MAGVRSKANRRGRYQGWFINASGKQQFFLGTRKKEETRRMAERLEDEHRQVRLGYRPAPSTADRHSRRGFEETVAEYLAWGGSQGGRGGRPWSETHARNRRICLAWWKDRLSVETLADLEGVLPRVEKALRELQANGKAGKTLANHAEALHALSLWCEQRGYLAVDPLKGLASFDTTPKTRRRALSAEEITRFLGACAPHLRLLYETAFLSGLRASELRSLTLGHLDRGRCGLRLDAAWTKNRQEGFQPLPRPLVERLVASAGESDRLYVQSYEVARQRRPAPKGRLLYVPWHTAQAVYADLERAGIPQWTPQGKVDFHALRVAFINMVIEGGATVKEAQVLARHSTPDLTMNVYGRTRPERLQEHVERMADRVLSGPDYVPSMYKQAVGAETIAQLPWIQESCAQ